MIYDFLKKSVKLIYSKLNFATWENIYKQLQKKDKPNILMGTMRLLRIEITLTWARQIVIIDLNYNAYLNDQVEKKIFELDNLMNL